MWYQILVFVLFCLAIIDPSVGVSNDAANFLNSAIGSNNELSYYSMNKVSNRLVRLQVNIILDLIELVKHAESIYCIHNSFNKDTLQG